ncbi:MAG TPA: terminase family protein [Gemmataceae bacterium]|nr:terminase family protein [Gemmataceae bacterium]
MLAELRQDPARLMTLAGLLPDPWQAALLRGSFKRVLLLASRQVGKSQTSAALALLEALLRPRSLVLLLSPSERQSGELAAKVFAYYDALGAPVPTRKRTELQLHLTNGSRIIALPESEKTIRGYSGARALVIDEAARVPDTLYKAVRPMLAVSRGRLIALSSAFAKSGFFFTEWTEGTAWERIKVPAIECPRIPAEFLEEERRTLGPRWFGMEYECEFADAVDQVFDGESIRAAFRPATAPPLF